MPSPFFVVLVLVNVARLVVLCGVLVRAMTRRLRGYEYSKTKKVHIIFHWARKRKIVKLLAIRLGLDLFSFTVLTSKVRKNVKRIS